jgi:peptidoglycan L-alanyl-D-glutamate endopeptidase CwlK
MGLSPRDRKRLSGLHPDLVAVVERAAELDLVAFMVLEGIRSPKRHAALLAAGASQTARSRHLVAPDGWAYAVDLGGLVPFEDADGDGQDDDGIHGLRWDWPLYRRLAEVVKVAADEIDVAIEWGGDWRRFKDGPHFQLPWRDYPGTAHAAGSGGRKVA